MAEVKAGIEVRRFACFNKYLNSKAPKIPHRILAQMLMSWGNTELAQKFVMKISDEEVREKYMKKFKFE